MRVALCYDLRDEYLAAGFGDEETAEFDRESTIDAIDAALCELGHTTERVGHLRALMCRLLDGSRSQAGQAGGSHRSRSPRRRSSTPEAGGTGCRPTG